MRRVIHASSLSAVILACSLLAPATASASAVFSVDTYPQWVTEIGPGGHVRPIQTWEEAGFELVYPGEQASFVVPTLSAVPDDEGKPAMVAQFSSFALDAMIIGGVVYDYGPDPDLTGHQIKWSTAKRGTPPPKDKDKPFKYSLHLIDDNGKKCIWVFDIPIRVGPADPWIDSEVDLGTNTPPPTTVETGFDVSRVKKIQWDWKAPGEGSGTPGAESFFKGKLDHIRVVPEPAMLSVFGLAMMSLTRRRR